MQYLLPFTAKYDIIVLFDTILLRHPLIRCRKPSLFMWKPSVQGGFLLRTRLNSDLFTIIIHNHKKSKTADSFSESLDSLPRL